MSHSKWHTAQNTRPDRRQDTGRAAKPWHWFSSHTIQAAAHYEDLRWNKILRQTIMALALLVISRLLATTAFGPFLLVGSAIWLILLVRIALIKVADDRGFFDR